MKNSATGIICGALICLTFHGSATAANRKAQKLAAETAKAHSALLAKFPAFRQIDTAIRADCAAKNTAKLSTEEFCACASAVTMSLWRTGADPQMIPRLAEYLGAPTDAGAQAFLLYQGPELYRPLCTEATGP